MPSGEWADSRRKLGMVNKNLWISLDAARSLGRLRDRNPGKSAGLLVSEAIIAYDRKVTKGDVLGRLNQALIDLRSCTEILETRTRTSKGA